MSSISNIMLGACKAFVIFVTLAPTLSLAADKLTNAIEKGLVTKELIDSLTDDDVPKKWRAKVEDKSTEQSTKKAFLRGKDRVLEVSWNKDWTGAKSNMFRATIYDGKQSVCMITQFADGTTNVIPLPGKTRDYYSIMTSVKKDGRMSVSVLKDGDIFEVVEVRGRDTKLLDDLEYTKTMLLTEQVVKPLLDGIGEQLDRKPTPKKRER